VKREKETERNGASLDDGASRSLELALYPIGSVGVGCRNGIASIVMSMLAQLVSRGKIASLSHSLRHRLVRRPAWASPSPGLCVCDPLTRRL